MADNPWIHRLRRVESPRLRLFLFPYAGGGPSAFRAWPALLPGDVELCAIHLPGRERRIAERPIHDMDALVRAIAAHTAEEMVGRFAFFGHSMGAHVAFRLARELAARGAPMPEALIASGARAPHERRNEAALHALADAELTEKLRRMGGTPAEVLDDAELVALILPAVRADLRALELAAPVPADPLGVPIFAYGGSEDEQAPVESLDAWRALTRGAFARRVFPGGHFYVQQHPRLVADALAADLAAPPATDATDRDRSSTLAR